MAVVLGLFGLGYIILGVQGQRLGDQYRTILSRINGSVSYINQLRVALTDSSEMITSASAAEELQARYQAVQDELDTGAGLFSGIRVPSPPQLPYTLLELQSAIEALGDTARQIGASYQSLQNRLFRYSVVLTTIGFLIMLGFITAAVYLRRFVAGFITYIHEGGEHLRAIIAHDNAPPPMHEPLWQEEFRYREIITSLEQVVSRERELSESIPTMPLEEFLPMLQDMIRPIVDFNRIAFAFTDRLGNVIADSAITSAEYVFLAPGFVEPLADTTLGEIVRSGKGRIIPDLSRHYLEVNQSRSTRQLLEEGVRSSMTIPFLFNGTCIGFLFLSSNEPDQFRPEHLSAVNQLVQVYKRSLYYQYLLQQVVAETSDAFVRLMEKKDNETSLHILRMAQYSHIIAQEYLRRYPNEQPTRFIREILWFAPLHDIGKIGVPDSVLLKPGALTREEYQIMQRHVELGESVMLSMRKGINRVLDMSLLDTAIDLVGTHHEKYDGSGYPRGLSGESIPLAGRIVAAADVFDALTSRRPYKEAWPVDRAIAVIRQETGTHFCPKVIRAMDAVLPQIIEVFERYKEV